MIAHTYKKQILRMGFIIFGALLFMGPGHTKRVDAACPPVSNPIGSVTSTISVSTAGTYRVWSRIQAPDATNNSYTLEIDGTTCGVVVGDSAIAANTWTWVDYQGGTNTNKTNVSLTAGQHTVVMYGRESGLKLDRLLFLADQACTPTGTGDNCASGQDSTPPTVSISAPTTASTPGTVTVSATASDAGGVSSVQLKLDGVVKGSFTKTTGNNYTFNLDLAGVSLGNHSLVATATDNNQNTANSTAAAISVTAPDNTPPIVSLTAPANNATVSANVPVTATASDNSGTVTKVELLVNNVVYATDTTAPYGFTWNTTTGTPDGTYTLTTKAYDPSSNTAVSTVTVTVKNAVALKPGDVNSDGKVDIFDLSILLSHYGQTAATRAVGDLNNDTNVNIFDLSILLTAWGT